MELPAVVRPVVRATDGPLPGHRPPEPAVFQGGSRPPFLARAEAANTQTPIQFGSVTPQRTASMGSC